MVGSSGEKIGRIIVQFLEKFLLFLSSINQVLNKLELPEYNMYLRPRTSSETATDLMEHSKTYLPKTVITRSELEMEEKKKHITFKSESDVHARLSGKMVEETFPKSSDLRVTLIFFTNE